MSASVLLRSSHIFSSLISPKCFRNGSCLEPHRFPLARQRHRLTSLLRYNPTCRLVVFSPAPTLCGRCSDQLQTSKRLFLVGLPGAGKTFLLGTFGKELESIYLSLTNQTTQQACQYLANKLRILRGIPPRSLPSDGEARASLQEELAASDCVLLIDHADQNPETVAAIAGFTPFNCSLVFAARTADAAIYHNAVALDVPPFTREEIQDFLKLHGCSSPPGELEYLCTVSHGNPLYLYYFVTQKVTPPPDGLRAYQEALIGRLSSDQRHVLAFIALSIVPLDLSQMHQLLLQDGTITGHALRTRDLVSTLGALVRSVDGRLELFHPYFREFIEVDIEQARLAKEYHLRLAEQAIKAQWVYPAAYHLCHAQDPTGAGLSVGGRQDRKSSRALEGQRGFSMPAHRHRSSRARRRALCANIDETPPLG